MFICGEGLRLSVWVGVWEWMRRGRVCGILTGGGGGKAEAEAEQVQQQQHWIYPIEFVEDFGWEWHHGWLTECWLPLA